MEESSNFASLGSILLARKGGAKPAMVPNIGAFEQGGSVRSGTAGDIVEPSLDENKAKNEANTPPSPASKLQNHADIEDQTQTDPGQNPDVPKATEIASETAVEAPEVHRQREELAQRLVASELQNDLEEAPVAAQPVAQQMPAAPTASAPKPRDKKPRAKAGVSTRRAAFTLRLDADRHLRLRLASTVSGQSAQQLVTQALDLFLQDMPEIELLAAQVSSNKKQ